MSPDDLLNRQEILDRERRRARAEANAREKKRRKCELDRREAPQPSEAAQKRAWAATLEKMETKLRAEEEARGEFSASVRVT